MDTTTAYPTLMSFAFSSCARVHAPQLRHPNILAFKDSAEVQEKGATVIYLVTQPVRSLKTVLEELDLQGQH
eukprot:scaffold71829_cov15-Tisochrysis_lutea.AAC.1